MLSLRVLEINELDTLTNVDRLPFPDGTDTVAPPA